jgi:HD-GYP domain-containing protein (c-di-GMP phosphodiesterase class II)
MSEPLALSIQRPKNCAYEEGLEQQWAGEHDRHVESLRAMFDDWSDGKPGSLELLRQQCETILSRLERDADALVCLAGSPYSTEYPSRHAIHVASMAMAVGIELGFDHENLMELGIGCLIHDVGMQLVGLEWFDSATTISPTAIEKLADHPVAALEVAAMLSDSITDTASMIAYQMHERLDGSGYPRGYTANQIHMLAKVAAVADEFVALVAPRPHRPGVQGYYAIKHILDETKRGKLDPRAVRALLQTTGLFPIGSLVELTNDRVGRVIRSGGELFDKPTIEMWSANGAQSKPIVINLQEEDSIQVARTLPLSRAA